MNPMVMPQADRQRLTPRQRECLRHVYERRTSKEIAGLTGLAVGTVDTYIAEAVTALGARNRRHAADLLHQKESPIGPPGKIEPEETGGAVSPAPLLVPEPRLEPRQGAAELLFRHRGALGNDLGPITRLVAIFGFAISLAAGFGMLAVGMRVISDVAGGLR